MDRSSVPQLGTPEQPQGHVHSPANCIPPEVLELTFNRAIPPHALLDQALCSGDRSPWCHTLRLMKSIVLVCRSWYKVGTGFLYQHICIRRFPQLQSLRGTLYTSDSSPRNLGALVKSLDIRCHIPEELAPEFAENLGAVMKLCPFLSAFGYISPCTLPLSALPTSCLKSQVTHLHLHHTICYTDLFSILRDLQDQLLVLYFEISPKYLVEPLGLFPDPKKRLFFPSLLMLSFCDWRYDEIDLLNVLKADWSMPSLQRLTISEFTTMERYYQEAIIDFLSTHGRRLRHLHMGIWPPFELPLSKALEQCPLLERLVMHPATFERTNGIPEYGVLHTKLRFLDLVYSFSERFDYADSKLWISKEVLPSLELVRHLCNVPTYLCTWVDSFEPCLEIGSNYFTIGLFQHQVIYKYGALLYNFRRNEKNLAIESHQEPGMPWRFTVWEDVADSDDEYYQEPDMSWRFSGWEEEAFKPDSEISSDESSSGDDEWMFDSADDLSTLSS